MQRSIKPTALLSLLVFLSGCNLTLPGSESKTGASIAEAISQQGTALPAPSPTSTPRLTFTPVPTLTAADFKIVVIGSSTAVGTGASSYSNSWVFKMYADLNYATGATLSQTNLAVNGVKSGDLTTSGLSDRNISKALSYQPNLIIVALTGGNDLSNGISEAEFFSNLDNIKNEAVSKHVAIFFTGTSPKNLSDYNQRQQLKNWNEIMQSREQSCNTPLNGTYSPCFINVFPGLADPSSLMINSNYAFTDGVHLNDRGHAYYESVVLPVIKEYVCRLVRCVH